MSKIFSNLKFLRLQKGLSQEQLADNLGITRSRLGAYEENRNENQLCKSISIQNFPCSRNRLRGNFVWTNQLFGSLATLTITICDGAERQYPLHSKLLIHWKIMDRFTSAQMLLRNGTSWRWIKKQGYHCWRICRKTLEQKNFPFLTRSTICWLSGKVCEDQEAGD